MKLLRSINLKPALKTSRFFRTIITCLVVSMFALPIVAALPKNEVTKSIDINAGINSAVNPLIEALNDSPWSTLMIFFICGSGVVGERSFRMNKEKE